MKRLSPRMILLGALIYVVSPVDILPDILGPLGRFDDLLIAGYLTYQALKRRSSPQQSHTQQSGSTKEHTRSESPKDPYEIFEISRNATPEEIDERYRELMKQYHPDKVASLGKELRELAHEKTIQIQAAYDQLTLNRRAG